MIRLIPPKIQGIIIFESLKIGASGRVTAVFPNNLSSIPLGEGLFSHSIYPSVMYSKTGP